MKIKDEVCSRFALELTERKHRKPFFKIFHPIQYYRTYLEYYKDIKEYPEFYFTKNWGE